jgi:hypothetical protein
MSGLNYLVQVNCYLLLFYCFYFLLLRNETFFMLNRVYLVGTALLAFIIPAMRVEWMHSLFVAEQIKHAGYVVSSAISGSAYPSMPAATEEWSTYDWLKLLYFTGAGVFLIRLYKRLYELRNPVNNENSGAYSFFNRVVVPADVQEHETIFLHERVHSLQWHSLDVIFFELVAVLNWFNPAMYLFKRTIRHIHEFIADEEAAKSRSSKADYAYLLINNAFGVSPLQLTSPFFNQSFLKRRIFMLHKKRSGRTALLKYGLSAPLFAGMIMLSSATVGDDAPLKALSGKVEGVAITTVEMLFPGSAAQSNDLAADSTATVSFADVDTPPTFPGGQQAIAQFIMKNFTWPIEAQKAGLSGRIYLAFVIERDGSLSNMKVLRDLGMGTGAEALRVLKLMPKWNPGIEKGEPVRVAFTLPLSLSVLQSRPAANKQAN